MLTFVDFSSFGLDYPVPVHREELQAVWAGAHKMVSEHEADELRAILERWELCLNYSVLNSEVLHDEWYTRALLCMAILGILGDRAPRFYEDCS